MTTVEWQDTSNEEDGEQYRFHIPSVILADLWHYDYEEWVDHVEGWRLNLAKMEDGEMVSDDQDFAEGQDRPAAEAKKWAEERIQKFLGKGKAQAA